VSSLRLRIWAGTVAVTAAVVLVAVACVWLAARSMLYRELDAKLEERARGFAVRGVPTPWLVAPGRPVPEEAARSWPLVQVARGDGGQELWRSPSLPGDSSLLDQLPPGYRDGEIVDGNLSDGRRVRIEEVTAEARREPDWRRPPADETPLPNGPFRVVVATDTTAAVDDLGRLGLLLLAVWVAAAGLATLAALGLRRAILRPVDRIVAEIASLDAATLSTRLRGEAVPLEMSPIIHRLNSLFSEVERAFQREKSTIANIAHELRTPIAGLRTSLEFALSAPAAEGERGLLGKCLEVVLRMQAMVANLLALARIESGQERWEAQPVDVASLLRSCWDALAEPAARRRQTISWTLSGNLLVASAPDKLRIALANLLDNAVAHAPEGSAIAASAALDGDRLTIEIANPTDGSLNDASAVFEPFWRGDAARTGGSHCGLGLTLVRRIVILLGGEVAALLDANRRFTVRLSLPAKPR
jgi:signal transduction histidine kinase